MKSLVVVSMLFFATLTSAAEVRIVKAKYVASTDSIDILAEVSGICEPSMSLRLRGCTDAFFPYTCHFDVNAKGEECESSSLVEMSYTRDDLGMKTRQFSDATLVVRNKEGSSKKVINLPINR